MRSVLRGLVVATTVGVVLAGAGVANAAPPTSAPTITSGPAASSFTNQTSATFTFTHSDPGASFTCSLNAAKATPCTSPVTYTGLTARTHSFAVRATSVGKKQSKPTTRSWTVDLTAPNAPTVSQPTSPTSSSSASISFSSSSTDVLSYRCSLDGAVPTTCTSPRSLSGLSQGYHTFAVQAVDRASNVSTARSVVWAVDQSVTAPSISSAPPSTSSPSVSFGFSSPDPDVTSYSCSMDSAAGPSFSVCTSPKSYAGLSAGSHTFRVKATDALGNVSAVTAYTWTVQAAPAVTLAWSDPGGLPTPVTNATGGTFAFSASGHTSLACNLDGVAQATCSSPETISGLADGQHTYAVVASPGAVTLTYRWTVDTTAPTAPTLEGPSGRTTSTDADITVVPAALGDSVTCTVDGVDTDCSVPFTLTGLSEGDHTVTATAADAAGNTSEASLDWTVDSTGPTAVVTAPATLSSPFVIDFDEAASGVGATSVVVTDEAGNVLATTQTCRDENTDVTDCSNDDVRQVDLTTNSKLVLGENYRVQVNPVGSEFVTDDLGNVATTTDDVVRAALTATESTAGATYSWRTISDRKAKGGSYVVEHRKGARATWSFSGKSVTWITVTGPAQGKAEVYVDGVRKTTVNNYAKRARYGVPRTIKGLAKGTHTIEVRALGKKGSKAGKGTYVAIDAFKVGKKVTTTPALTKVAWQKVTNAAAMDGSYVVADLKGQAAKLKVRGTAFSLTTAKGPTYGKVAVSVDGTLRKTVDLYAKRQKWNASITITGLADTQHTVVVKVLGSKSKASSGTAVVLDGFSVS